MCGMFPSSSAGSLLCDTSDLQYMRTQKGSYPHLRIPPRREAHRFLRLSAPTGTLASQLSSGWTRIGPSFALCMSSTGSSTRYFTFILFRALSTASSVSPATIATVSPTYLKLRIHDKTVVGTQFGIGLPRKGKPVLRHIFIGKYRRDPLHPARIIRLDFLHPGVRVGAAEQFDDQTVLSAPDRLYTPVFLLPAP